MNINKIISGKWYFCKDGKTYECKPAGGGVVYLMTVYGTVIAAGHDFVLRPASKQEELDYVKEMWAIVADD